LWCARELHLREACLQGAEPQMAEPLRLPASALQFPPESSIGPFAGAVVWLHGFSDKAETWAWLFRAYRAHHPRWKWVHLRAPKPPQPSYGGRRVAAWGEVLERRCAHVGSKDHENPGIYPETVEQVHQTIEALEAQHGVPPDRIVLGGFSQGAGGALESALLYWRRLAGCVVLSGWLTPRGRETLEDSANRHMPCLICHGVQDDKIGFDCAVSAVQFLETAGMPVQFERFENRGHTAGRRAQVVVAHFLRDTLPEQGMHGKTPSQAEDRRAAHTTGIAPFDESRSPVSSVDVAVFEEEQGGDDRVLDDATQPNLDQVFVPGTWVRVVGLLGRPQDNGRKAEVIFFDANAGCYIARPQGMKGLVKLKPRNVEAWRPAPIS